MRLIERPLAKSYGWWKVVGKPRLNEKREPIVAVRCTGPDCKGERVFRRVTLLLNASTHSCGKCAKRRSLRNGFGMGGFIAGGF